MSAFDWTLFEREFSDGSSAATLLRQAADWLDSLSPHAVTVTAANWSYHEWVGGGGGDDVLTLYLHADPAAMP